MAIVIFAVLTISSTDSVMNVIDGIYRNLDAGMVISESAGNADADRASLIITAFLSVGALSNAVISVFFFVYGCIKQERAKEMIAYLREFKSDSKRNAIRYRPGQTVMMEHMDDPNPVEYGTMGVIDHVDDIGTLHVRWEDGREYGILPGIDSFRLIDDREIIREKEER